ncbi:IS6 family transposase [Flammeovirga aprica]|uniref:IS6 family transposase n=1 Tax=Flammeovirga aprica JL-4 TaxID=694437 RepID=A0A7X9XCX3_9BACT|nr:IS6 family transposase [Flammeovirga aprica]NME72190.1 IS6 family transposase [Flammeovirga aprica JL-4]
MRSLYHSNKRWTLLEELLSIRNIFVDHSSVQLRGNKYSSLLSEKMRKRKKYVGCSWYWDETYVKVLGAWMYLHRAVDKEGNTIDFNLSKNCEKKAVLTFSQKAIESNNKPLKVSMDKSGVNIVALDHLSEEYKSKCKQPFNKRNSKYLNKWIEQDYRFIKKRVKSNKLFKSFVSAKHTISGLVILSIFVRKYCHNFSFFSSNSLLK